MMSVVFKGNSLWNPFQNLESWFESHLDGLHDVYECQAILLEALRIIIDLQMKGDQTQQLS